MLSNGLAMPNRPAVPAVFIRGSRAIYTVYVSPNTDTMPEVPEMNQSLRWPFSAFERGWATDESFYTAFIPESNPFDDSVLGMLNAA